MKKTCVLLIAALLALAGCGGDDEDPAAGSQPGTSAPTRSDAVDGTAVDEESGRAAERDPEDAARRKQGVATKLVVGESEFGAMLFGADKQAVYIFENDSRETSRCYGECAAAWPPVLTDRDPRAGTGVRAPLLGTIKRRDGKLQVSYAGMPLYYYAHEEPGEVRCHDVDLNGGLWWVVGSDGKRRP